MADVKITQLTAATAVTDDDLLVLVNDPAGSTPTTNKITAADARAYLAGVSPLVAIAGATTLALAHLGATLLDTGGAAHDLTIPPNSSVAFPLGTVISHIQRGSGPATWAAGAGVVRTSRGSVFTSNGVDAVSTATKVAADAWVIAGDLV